MLFNVWYPHPTPIYSEVESQWDRFELDAITVLA